MLSSLFAIALARWQDVRELVVTYPVNMRSPGFRDASGCFVNNLPMIFRCGRATRSSTSSRAPPPSVRRPCHQQLSLTDLVTALRRTRSLADAPVFNVGVTEAFFVQDAPLAFHGVQAELLPAVAAERPFDLNFAYQLTPDGLHVNLEYDTGRVPAARIGEFAASFGRLLRAYLDDDAQPALAVDLLAPSSARLARYWHGRTPARRDGLAGRRRAVRRDAGCAGRPVRRGAADLSRTGCAVGPACGFFGARRDAPRRAG